jgi:hypothetical protein
MTVLADPHHLLADPGGAAWHERGSAARPVAGIMDARSR